MEISSRSKRLAVIVIIAIGVIFVSKFLLNKVIKNLSLEAKKRSAPQIVVTPVPLVEPAMPLDMSNLPLTTSSVEPTPVSPVEAAGALLDTRP